MMASIVSPGLMVEGTEMPVMRALARDRRPVAKAIEERIWIFGIDGVYFFVLCSLMLEFADEFGLG